MTNGRWKAYGVYLALLGLAAFLVVQVTVATGFGLTNARTASSQRNAEALLFVSFVADYPSLYNGMSSACRAVWGLSLAVPAAMIRDAANDQLGEFQPALDRHYLSVGRSLPRQKPIPACRDESR